MTEQRANMMREVVSQNLNAIPTEPSGTADSFGQLVSVWFGRWWKRRAGWQTVSPGYCSIICDASFSENPAFSNFELAEMFREAPSAQMGGAIYVTDSVMGKVYRNRGSFGTADAIIKEIRSIGLESYPTVLFEPEVGTILLAIEGINMVPTIVQLGAFSPELTVANVDNQLTVLYNSTLKYSSNFPHIWFKADNYIPIFKAEKLFQSTAMIHLRAVAQDTWLVRSEDDNNAGRTDISIASLNPNCVFVLEIKILKSFHYTADQSNVKVQKDEANEKWADDGITQVLNYRLAQGADEAFLLLYDLRKKDEDIPSVVKRCNEEKVHPRRYYIHNATAAAVIKRTAQIP